MGSFQGVKVPPIEEIQKPEDRYAKMTEEEKQLETERQMQQFAKMLGGAVEDTTKE